jgi:hypothetical protein
LDIFKAFATDPKLEQEGKDFDFGGGVTLKIARSYNPTFVRMLNKQFEAHKHTLELKSTPQEVAAAEECSNKIMAYVMSRSVLLGWSGPVEYDGVAVSYSPEAAEKMLMLKDFQKEISKRADEFKNFRIFSEDADVKNSSTTSSGTSPGVAALPTLNV